MKIESKFKNIANINWVEFIKVWKGEGEETIWVDERDYPAVYAAHQESPFHYHFVKDSNLHHEIRRVTSKKVWQRLDRFILTLLHEDLSRARAESSKVRKQYKIPWNFYSRELVMKKPYSPNAEKAWGEGNKKYLLIHDEVKQIPNPNKGESVSLVHSEKKSSRNALTYEQRKKVEKLLKRLRRENSNLLILSREELAETLTKELGFVVTPDNLKFLMKSLGIQTPRKRRERKVNGNTNGLVVDFSNRLCKTEQQNQKILQVLQQLVRYNFGDDSPILDKLGSESPSNSVLP